MTRYLDMNHTFDRDERRRQRVLLQMIYPDYDAKRHDSYVIQYQQLTEKHRLEEYLRARGVK